MPGLKSVRRVFVRGCFLAYLWATGALIHLDGEPPRLANIMQEFNAGPLDTVRVQHWATTLGEHPPAYWQLTPGEYVAAVLSLCTRLKEQGLPTAQLLETAIQQAEAEAGPSTPELLPLLDELAAMYSSKGQIGQAISVERRALRIAQLAVGEIHPSLAGRIRHLADELKKSRDGSAIAETADLDRLATALETDVRRQSAYLISMGANEPRPSDANAEVVQVFYATNRARRRSATDAASAFGSRRDLASDALSYGRVIVSVPRASELKGIRDGRYWVGEILKSDYKKAVMVNVSAYDSGAAFAAAVHDRVKSTARRELMIFVHGYATDWETAVKRTAALAVGFELDGAPILFSWPSRGDVLSYVADGNEVTSTAIDQLKNLIESVLQAAQADRVYVIAHSMGARFVLSALERLGRTGERPIFSNLIFASPDVDGADFAKRVPKITKLARRTSLYVSDNDRALQLSSMVNDSPRAGQASAAVVVDGADTVDTTLSPKEPWSIDGLIRHNDFANGALDDVRAVLWHGLSAQQRCILSPSSLAAGKIWNLRPADDCSVETFKMGIHAARRLGAEEAASFLAVQERETCRNWPNGNDCRSWREAHRIAELIRGAAAK